MNDHEKRMAMLHAKAMKEKKEAEIAVIKFTAAFIIACPLAIMVLKAMIDFAWAYSYATRGF